MPSINEIWETGFIELGNKYVTWYLDGSFQLEWLAKNVSMREAITEVYNVLVKSDLTPIENIPQEQKVELWEHCKPFIINLSTPDRIKFCKCYWALSWLAGKRVY